MIYVIMCNLFSSVLVGKRFYGNAKYVICILLWMSMEFLVSAVFDHYVILKMLIVVFLDIIFLKLLYQFTITKSIGTACLYQAICVLADYLVFVLVKKIVNGIELTGSTETVTGYLMGTLSQLLVILFVVWFKNCFCIEKEHIMTQNEWIKFMTVPIFSMITILALIVNFEGKMTDGQENTVLFVVFGLALMNIFVFHLILDVVRREKKSKQEAMLLEHAEQTERLYLQEKKRLEELQRQKHEYKNQMLVIHELLQEEEYDRISGYIQEFSEEAEQINRFDTNHPIVNAILNLKYMDALNRKILMIVRFNDLSEIPLKDNDIISIFANLLDNAIEASEKCVGRQSLVKVKFVVENGRMVLAVSNVWNGNLVYRNGKIISSKLDGKLHGFGIENIKRIVEKYDGIYTMNDREEEFRFVVSIPLLR